MSRSRPYYQCLFILSLLLDFYSCTCPDACEPCIVGHLYCVNPGLTEIPTSTEYEIKKMTLQKQTFLSTDLSSTNFSSFSGITQLSIRTSNINKVLPFTFSNMTSLQELDLSDHTELIVKQMAFFGLNLQILKLDNMGLITLDLDAFQGLGVRSLSIQNSNLLSLPLKLIQPLSRSILKLFLKNNLLRTLDPQLQPIFQSIEVLQLQKNPFICNCSILWLSKILQLSTTVNSKSNEHMFETSDEQFPSCVSPAELRKQFLHAIINKLKDCSPPNINRIDVTFESFSSAIIDCFADTRKDVHYQTFVGWVSRNEAFSDLTQWKTSLKVVRHSQKKFLCRAFNVNGNSEIEFQIDWFKLPKELKNVVNKSEGHKTITRENHSILWRNVFSLFEMICAIVGTLIITVMIFLIFCCCHGCRLHIPFFEQERKFIYKTPTLYERGVYNSDRRFYETDIDGHLFPPPPPTPPPLPANRIPL